MCVSQRWENAVGLSHKWAVAKRRSFAFYGVLTTAYEMVVFQVQLIRVQRRLIQIIVEQFSRRRGCLYCLYIGVQVISRFIFRLTCCYEYVSKSFISNNFQDRGSESNGEGKLTFSSGGQQMLFDPIFSVHKLQLCCRVGFDAKQ